jgi:NAD(P)-dependent dehydrogenase (short-subunit alcohol dehydrogenase family)
VLARHTTLCLKDCVLHQPSPQLTTSPVWATVPAGIAYKGSTFGPDEAQTTLATNFLGTKAVCEAVLPLMGKGGRIVNVSSTYVPNLQL